MKKNVSGSAFVADFGTQNFNFKNKFDMENETSTNHENGNDSNRLLAGRCFSCKHWVDNYYLLRGYSDRHKICNIANLDDSGGFIDAICFGEGIGGEFITRDDFWCVLYNAS